MVRSELKIYESLDDYIGDYTIKSDVELANFKTIFQYFCYLYVLIILAFVLHHIYNCKRMMKNLKIRKLQ